MYTPKHFEEKDREILADFIRKYNFGLLVTSSENYPTGTHLPFIIEHRGEELVLISHLAKANKQWKDFNSKTNVLVVFSEPHAYISTSFYTENESVPTWN